MKPKNFQWAGWGWAALAAVYAGTFVTILVLAYTGNLSSSLQQNDKLGHVVLYALATYLGHRLWKNRQVKLCRRSLPMFPFLFSLFTVTEEGLQGFSPNRTLDGGDLIASFIGIGIGYWLVERGTQSGKAPK